MKARRILMVGLDGFDLGVAKALLARRRLPALEQLSRTGATVLLDHGPAKRTGLAWEHVSSGHDPASSERWGAVDFDPRTYTVKQRPTRLAPFLKDLDIRAVVFDAPYFDIGKAANASGLVAWGAHDPGVMQAARPSSLKGEILKRFGAYPASEWIYGFTWPSAERTRTMGQALTDAVKLRSSIAQWLLSERLPEWDLSLVVISEYHSAIEAMWHGVDERHPLHPEPSAAAAKAAIEAVYEAADGMLGALMERFPDATILAFSMHGMGPNNADVASMLLLPELLYRHHFGVPLFHSPQWPASRSGVPAMGHETSWEAAVSRGFPDRGRDKKGIRQRLSRFAGRLGDRLRGESSLEWMPACRYRPYWGEMPAFALPGYYDGRIRLNLVGRERKGLVRAADYDAACSGVERLLEECTDPLSGDSVVASFERSQRHCMDLSTSEADVVVHWQSSPLGFSHPRVGQIGPVPYRRPGGHTGKTGVAFFSDPAAVGSVTAASSFDVVPTIVSMLGLDPLPGLAGRTLVPS